ncbi:MAG: phosphoenolpyruvate synthase, partial [Deltaproteobacteria bacterium]|nr:phosphoenolpyruvate synthase [Deltaproteobacteria bacterium]
MVIPIGTFVKFFEEMTREDIQEAGGKAANLGELTQAGFNVPPGFCVLADSLHHHLEKNDLQPKINGIVAGFDYEDYAIIEGKTNEIRDLIISAPIPADLLRELTDSIDKLTGPDQVFVAVRSSVAVKGLPISSFPGMMDTF